MTNDVLAHDTLERTVPARPRTHGLTPHFERPTASQFEPIVQDLVNDKWHIPDAHKEEVRDMALRLFTGISSASVDFLNAVMDYDKAMAAKYGTDAHKHTIIGKHSSSTPKIYFETLDRMLQTPDLSEADREPLHAVRLVEARKSQQALDAMREIKTFFEARPELAMHVKEQAYADKSSPVHFKMLGSIIRQVINTVMQDYHYEINFSKNPQAALANIKPATAPAPV